MDFDALRRDSDGLGVDLDALRRDLYVFIVGRKGGLRVLKPVRTRNP